MTAAKLAVCLLMLRFWEVTASGNGTGININTYDPGALLMKIFNFTQISSISSRQARKIAFEGETDSTNYGLVTFHNDIQRPLKFEDDGGTGYDEDPIRNEGGSGYGLITFKDENTLEDEQNQHNNQIQYAPVNNLNPNGQKKRKRRRRKPRVQRPIYPGYPPVGQGLGYPGYGQIAGPPQGAYYPRPGFQESFNNRPPSVASDALSAVTGALTSIALYDDYQCVPRLLCEAAGGGLPGSGLLQSVAGLQPILTLLSAYNGISSSPLFVFGRAVFLGMTSKGNAGTCRYAYPLCPTDPEQLVHYLNNHNGGFFKFFSTPQQNVGQQNLQQFYNQLSFPGQVGTPNYGLYQGTAVNQQQYLNGNTNPVYNNLYNTGTNYVNGPTYGGNYPHNSNKYGLYQGQYKTNELSKDIKITKRIQNKPTESRDYIENENYTSKHKFQFPEDDTANKNYDNTHYGISENNLQFPKDDSFNAENSNNDFTRKRKGIYFPGDVNNQQSYVNPDNYYLTQNILSIPNREQYVNIPDNNNNYKDDYYNEYINNLYSNINPVNYNSNNNYNNNQENVQLVYVVRGNGDPNHPEIVKLRPGEKL